MSRHRRPECTTSRNPAAGGDENRSTESRAARPVRCHAASQAIADPAPTVVVDLRKVEFIAVKALRVLLAATHTVAPRPVRLLTSPQVHHALTITDLDQAFTIHPT